MARVSLIGLQKRTLLSFRWVINKARALKNWFLDIAVQWVNGSQLNLLWAVGGLLLLWLYKLVVAIATKGPLQDWSERQQWLSEVLDFVLGKKAQNGIRTGTWLPLAMIGFAAALDLLRLIVKRLSASGNAEKLQLYERLAEANKEGLLGLLAAHRLTYLSADERAANLLMRVASWVATSFDVICPDKKPVKVCIMPIVEGKVSNAVDSWPRVLLVPEMDLLNTDLKTLNDDKSCAMYMVRKKKRIIVIEDLHHESLMTKSRFLVCPNNPEGARGSLIGYSLMDEKKSITFLVFISTNAPIAFSVKNEHFYTQVLDTIQSAANLVL